jgi:hypothetical protein
MIHPPAPWQPARFIAYFDEIPRPDLLVSVPIAMKTKALVEEADMAILKAAMQSLITYNQKLGRL